jgi:hypothetical protein
MVLQEFNKRTALATSSQLEDLPFGGEEQQ